MLKTYAQKILDGEYKIPISALSEHEYCKRQIYLKFVRGIKAKPTTEILAGQAAHKALDLEHYAQAIPMSLEEAFELAQSRTVIIRDLEVESKKLKGKIDEIQISPNEILIVEDKPIKNHIWPGQKLQVWGYCYAFTKDIFENKKLEPNKPLVGSIRDINSKQIFWQEKYTDDAKNLVENTVTSIEEILRGKEPKPLYSEKCTPCRYQKYCG
ncbi:MAG: CRISPR-associated protein Cas4 [Candidatus Nanoarchaeia archaeon]